MTKDITDKYDEYKVNLHCNETHSEEEFDADDDINAMGHEIMSGDFEA